MRIPPPRLNAVDIVAATPIICRKCVWPRHRSLHKSLEMKWMKGAARNTNRNVVNIEDDGSTRFHKAEASEPMSVGLVGRDHLLFGEVVYLVSI
jgi:hypothetical protein